MIKDLIDKGIAVRILNMGTAPIDNSSTGMLLFNILLAFAQFERDMIWERTQEGKAISGNYGGRKKKYTRAQIDHAMELLDSGNSYGQVVEKSRILLILRKQSAPSETLTLSCSLQKHKF